MASGGGGLFPTFAGAQNQVYSTIANQLNKSTEKAIGLSQQGYNEAAAAAAQSNATSSAALNPFISAGTDAYHAYLDAIGVPYQTAAATPGQAAQTALPQSVLQMGPDGQLGLWEGGAPGTWQYKGSPQTPGYAKAAAAHGMKFVAGDFSKPAVAPTPAVYSQPDTQSILQRFMNSPGYQAMYQQGLSSLNSAASAQGLLGSGAQGQALEKFGANYAQTGYQNYLNNLLQGAQPGLTAAGQLSTNATSAGNALQGAATSAGNTQASLQQQTGTNLAKLNAETAINPESGFPFMNSTPFHQITQPF